eukprot:gnl/MRDRNA2_/MRDRNA2_60354_c0_seq1.p1 gnl/MRDRNA2_/MRDRNA2_60354_c0~~gnl/MRDRNA2_/MRDRNA2_60354_c0_seq1.p1  ORF type:complete len:329 (-),score=94.97 gnl/MRDRNA2_/MRDRNA2_60354_c0_seq1:27-1013(-)
MIARVALLIGLVSALPDKADKFNPLKKFDAAATPKKQANLKAYFVNTEKSQARSACMTRQLNEQGIENERFSAVVMKECPDFDFTCMNDVVFNHHKDCFKSGADLLHLTQHGSSGKDASMKNRAMAVLANWCSHKRLFQQISTNTSSKYDVQTLGRNFFREKLLNKEPEKTAQAAKKSEKVYIILEDDAILRPQFAEKVQDFIQNYDGKWDMLQVDTFGGVDGRDKIGDFKGVPVYHPGMKGDYFGLHCMLIKESSMGKINLEMGLMPAVPVDWFPKLLKEVPDTKVLVWNPDIVRQPEMKTAGKDVTLPQYCDQSVLLSTIGGETQV